MDIMALLKKRYEDEENRLASDRKREKDLERDSFISGLSRIAEDAGNNALKFRSLGGQSMDVRPSNRAAEDYRMARADEKELRAANKSSGRDLLDRLQRLKEKEDTDKKYAKEWDYKLERDRESDKLAREKLDFQKVKAKNKYDKTKDLEASEKKMSDQQKLIWDSVGKPSLTTANKLRVGTNTGQAEIDGIRKYLDEGQYEKAMDAAKKGLKVINLMITGSPDAVGMGEIKVLAPELERSLENWFKRGKFSDVRAFTDQLQTKVEGIRKVMDNERRIALDILEGKDYFADLKEQRSEPKESENPEEIEYEEVLDESGKPRMAKRNNKWYPVVRNPKTGELSYKIPAGE